MNISFNHIIILLCQYTSYRDVRIIGYNCESLFYIRRELYCFFNEFSLQLTCKLFSASHIIFIYVYLFYSPKTYKASVPSKKVHNINSLQMQINTINGQNFFQVAIFTIFYHFNFSGSGLTVHRLIILSTTLTSF